MKRASSLRLSGPKPIGRSSIARHRWRLLCCVLRGPLDRGDDVLVARAAADRAGDRGADLVPRSGSGSRPAARASVISIPGVQKPQCSACFSWKPCWSGSSTPSTSSDSTVRISWPSHIAASAVHDFSGLPSISTTQAPQLDVSQPQWVPVRPGGVADEVDEQRARLDVARHGLAVDGDRVSASSGLLLERAGRRAAQGAFREHAREVALVVDRSAAVGDRQAVLGGDRARLLEQVVATGLRRAAAPPRG